MRNLRIGIDVGGTFTHAVAVELPGNQVIAHAVTPTTHTADSSVSEGIIKVFREVIEKSALGNPGFGGNACERDLGNAADQQQLLQCVENSIASVGSHVM